MAIGFDNHLITARPADKAIECGYPRELSRVHIATESAYFRQWHVGRQFCQFVAQLRTNSHQTVVHDHAVWLASNHAIAVYCRRHRLKRVVSPRGMLGKWALENGKWKKRIAWHLYQRRDLQTAAAFHATSDQEAEEIRALGLSQPISVVPNGITIPDQLPRKRNVGKLTALFLSRIHPKKGLLMLVEAWKRANVGSNWQLVIAGPDEGGHRGEVEAAVHRCGLQEQVVLIGSINDEDKWQLYVDADLFILPSFNENFGIVIAEAMAAGLPVITTTSTPWKVLTDKKIGWWVKPEVEALQAAVRDATQADQTQLISMGKSARDHVTSTFSWSQAASSLGSFYQHVLDI